MFIHEIGPREFFVVTPPRHTLNWIRASVFQVNKPVTIPKSEIVDVELKLQPHRRSKQWDTTYFTPSDHVANIAAYLATQGYNDGVKDTELHFVNPLELDNFVFHCPNLTVEVPYFNTPTPFPDPNLRFAHFLNRDTLRIGIVNAFGGGWGDLINGITALFHLRRFFVDRGVDVVFRLFSLKAGRLRLLIERDPTIRRSIELIEQMPAPLSHLLECDFFFDVSNCTGWPSFQQPFVDYYLNAFSINPVMVSPWSKRHIFELSEKDVDEETVKIVDRYRDYILLAPNATAPIRSLSEPVTTEICKYLLETTNVNIILFGREKEGFDIDVEDERVLKLPHGAKSFLDALYILKNAVALIAVDSALAHFADAFDIPTLAVFTTIQPHHRAAYYPHCLTWLASTKPTPLFVGGVHVPPEVQQKVLAIIHRVLLPMMPTLIGNLRMVASVRYECPQCSTNLERLQRRFRSGAVTYQCPLCGLETMIDPNQEVSPFPLPHPYALASSAAYLNPIPKSYIKIEAKERVYQITKTPSGVMRQPLIASRQKVEEAIHKTYKSSIKKKEEKHGGSDRKDVGSTRKDVQPNS